MSYPGGKSGAGVYQTIINQMPPHEGYYEPFLGGAGVMRRKRPARVTIGIDVDPEPVELARASMPGFQFLRECGIGFLGSHAFKSTDLVYADPPYVMESRKSDRPIYAYEMGDIDHAILVNTLRTLPCRVMVSGYASPLYDARLADWRRIEYQASTRGGMATEVLWCNFPEPPALHDYSFIGNDYRQRERISRKVKRFTAKFAGLDRLERQAILSALTTGQEP